MITLACKTQDQVLGSALTCHLSCSRDNLSPESLQREMVEMKTPPHSHGGGHRGTGLDPGLSPSQYFPPPLGCGQKGAQESFAKVNWEQTGLLHLTSALPTSPAHKQPKFLPHCICRKVQTPPVANLQTCRRTEGGRQAC